MTLDHEVARNRLTRTRGDGRVYAGWLLIMAVVGVAATLATVSPAQGGERARECLGLSATVVGTARSDLLIGTPRRDVIIGGGAGDLNPWQEEAMTSSAQVPAQTESIPVTVTMSSLLVQALMRSPVLLETRPCVAAPVKTLFAPWLRPWILRTEIK